MLNRSVKVIISGSILDFGRCSLASSLPAALWPVAGKPAIERIIENLPKETVTQAIIFANEEMTIFEKLMKNNYPIDVKFIIESLPLGTAGCIRDAAGDDKNSLFILMPAQITSVPDINFLVEAHQAGKADLTIVFEPSVNGQTQKSIIYICEPSILNLVPSQGYCDIKECLIPAMLRKGKTVHAAQFDKSLGYFRDHHGYLNAMNDYMEDIPKKDLNFKHHQWNGSENILVAGTAKIETDARIFGHVLVMDNACIGEKAIIYGPAIIGQNVSIGKGTLVKNSVLWDGSIIGKNSQIHNSILDYNARVSNNLLVSGEVVMQSKPNYIYKTAGILKKVTSYLYKTLIDIKSKKENLLKIPSVANLFTMTGAAVLLVTFLWSYWPTFADLWKLWQQNDDYSSGILVPFLAFYALWARRGGLRNCQILPSLWGLAGLIAAQGLRYFGLFYMYASAERLSLILSIASVILLLLGRKILLKTASILLFLCLMLPLPRMVQTTVSLPLQNLATSSAVYLLQILGYAVSQEGNIIHLYGISVAVEEACNGLRMITAFFAIIGLIVLLVQRRWWEKMILLISALPIAILCNSIRLAITAVAFTFVASLRWETAFHSLGGYAMMPLALLIAVFELWFLTKITNTGNYKINFNVK